MQQENLADIRHKLSIIYKHIQSMHSELRYQAKIHTISKKLSKEEIKILSSPPIFFFSVKNKNRQKNNKNLLWGKETISSPSMWGKIKHLLRERGLKIQRQESSRPTCFFYHP
jgi:hypothetical protein